MKIVVGVILPNVHVNFQDMHNAKSSRTDRNQTFCDSLKCLFKTMFQENSPYAQIFFIS